MKFLAIEKNTFSDRNSSTVGPRLWNALPLELKKCESVDTFKRHLKTYVLKVSKGAKIRNRYNQVPHLTQDTN